MLSAVSLTAVGASQPVLMLLLLQLQMVVTPHGEHSPLLMEVSLPAAAATSSPLLELGAVTAVDGALARRV